MKTGKEHKFSKLFYNAVTYAGVMLSILVATLEAFLFALDFFDKGRNLYLGLITYLILPGVLVLGLLLIPLGVLWKKRRIDRGLPNIELRRFRVDLAIPQHRNAILVFIVGTSVLVLMSVIGSYKAFHYTESVQFCGVLCHDVMHPEYTAYTQSPHGRVKCVECHIGEGADWYVRSKMSGARQVVKTLARNYEKPIHTPVHNLRPAEETCKQCHSPGKFFSTLDFRRSYFLSAEDNPRWEMRMLLNVGSGENRGYGVHAHMNLDHDIYYVADDGRRQKISWVKSVGKDGAEKVFTSPDSKYKDAPPPADLIRKMDCIDCHNRPTHQFLAPYRLVNDAMQRGTIDPAIPFIKERSLEALSADYASGEEASRKIPEALSEFYRTKVPDFYASHRDKIDKAAGQIVDMHRHNLFPEMKVRWDTHPDNIGHLVSPGCFRCHDGEHRAAGSDRVISRDCKSCHVIVEQGPAGATEKNIDGLEFRHPDGGEEWKEMSCNDCHTGGT
ncbi:MAG: NapC/NirT family cytochrome c [Candidatus Omnitrophica bacterium]|nr:NapC/NirT family cytochrome c [Candidatus Omnitrophota bacterium]